MEAQVRMLQSVMRVCVSGGAIAFSYRALRVERLSLAIETNENTKWLRHYHGFLSAQEKLRIFDPSYDDNLLT